MSILTDEEIIEQLNAVPGVVRTEITRHITVTTYVTHGHAKNEVFKAITDEERKIWSSIEGPVTFETRLISR